MSSDVTFHGPLFDGRAGIDLREGEDAIRRELAREGQRLAVAAFTAAIRRNTGRFLASITSTSRSRTYTTASRHKVYTMPVVVSDNTETVVTTDLATYGPWLEGEGSRNAPVTRFPGYHGFRQAAQELDRMAKAKAEEAIRPYVERMN